MPKIEWWGETGDAMGWESETMQKAHRFKAVVFFCQGNTIEYTKMGIMWALQEIQGQVR